MAYWIREFTNVKTGARFRVSSAIHYIPPLRREIAKKLNDQQWEDDNLYKHDAGLDMKLEGLCPELAVELDRLQSDPHPQAGRGVVHGDQTGQSATDNR